MRRPRVPLMPPGAGAYGPIMKERRTPWCEGIDEIELLSVEQHRADQPRHFLEYADGDRGEVKGPYRVEIPSTLMQWLTRVDPGARYERAMHVLRVHLGMAEESAMPDCPRVPRRKAT